MTRRLARAWRAWSTLARLRRQLDMLGLHLLLARRAAAARALAARRAGGGARLARVRENACVTAVMISFSAAGSRETRWRRFDRCRRGPSCWKSFCASSARRPSRSRSAHARCSSLSHSPSAVVGSRTNSSGRTSPIASRLQWRNTSLTARGSISGRCSRQSRLSSYMPSASAPCGLPAPWRRHSASHAWPRRPTCLRSCAFSSSGGTGRCCDIGFAGSVGDGPPPWAALPPLPRWPPPPTTLPPPAC